MNEHRPVYRIAAAGLDPRDARLIEIVFKHSQYNRFAFVLEPAIDPDRTDILIVDTADPEGLRAVASVRGLARHVPVIAAVQRGVPSPTRHAISVDRLTLQLLPILNRVVETELLSPETQPMTMPMTLPLPAQDAAAFLVKPAVSAWPVPEQRSAQSVPAARSTPDASAELASRAGAGGSSPAAERRVGVTSSAAAAHSAVPVTSSPASPGSAMPTHSAPVASASSASTTSGGAPSAGLPSDSMPCAGAPADAAPAPGAPDARPPSRAAPRRGDAAAANAAPPTGTGSAAGSSPARSNLVEFPRAATQQGQGPRIRVLVVDDSPTVRQQLGVAFTRMGLVCEMVPSGAQALERLEISHFDLVMVDVVIPDMDGYRLTREIRKRHRGMPVIILSSRSSPFDYARGILAGCKAYLSKPVPLRQLEAAMRKVLRRSLAIDDLPERLRAPAAGARAGADAPQAPDPRLTAGHGRRA